jgi:hypothetical protein
MNYLCNCDPCNCPSDGANRATSSAEKGGGHQLPGSSTPKDETRVRRLRKIRSPDRRRVATCAKAGEAQEPPIGAHLITLRRGYTHHGIYAGQGSVLHYAGLARDLRPGPVEEVSLERFANGRPVYIECRSTPALDEQNIVSRARSRLGENRYRLLTNNCEHFCEWSRFGASRSHQVERWLGFAPAATRILVANIGSRLARFRPQGRMGALA